jgi:hypothetical protein
MPIRSIAVILRNVRTLLAQSGLSAQLVRVNASQVNAFQIKALAQVAQQDAHLIGQ